MADRATQQPFHECGSPAWILLCCPSSSVKNMISRSHSKIVCDAATSKVTIFDLNSTNGIYVNDRKIDVCQLTNGDRITFGGRGKAIPVGTVDPQPDSEFIYEFQQEAHEDEEEEETVFEAAKGFTDNLQVILTWISAAILVGSYLFAEESSAEFSYVGEYVSPLFTAIGVPFTRVTFTVSFVVACTALLALTYWLFKSNKTKKGKGKKKAA